MQFDKSLADSAGPRETRDGAYRQREAFSPLDRTENVEVHHALHRRVLAEFFPEGQIKWNRQ